MLTPAGQTGTIQALALPDSKDDARAKVARQQVCFALYRVFVQQYVACGLWAGKDEGPFKGAMHHGERTWVDRTRRREARLKDLCGGEIGRLVVVQTGLFHNGIEARVVTHGIKDGVHPHSVGFGGPSFVGKVIEFCESSLFVSC